MRVGHPCTMDTFLLCYQITAIYTTYKKSLKSIWGAVGGFVDFGSQILSQRDRHTNKGRQL